MQIYDMPDVRGHFGQFGGIFVAETLVEALEELRRIAKENPYCEKAHYQLVCLTYQQTQEQEAKARALAPPPRPRRPSRSRTRSTRRRPSARPSTRVFWRGSGATYPRTGRRS